jgi:hypothetical protein
MAIQASAGSVAEAVAPWFVGRVRDSAGSDTESFLALTGIALLGAASVAK